MSFGWVVARGFENQLVVLSPKISVVAAEGHDRWGLLDTNRCALLIADCDRCPWRIGMDSHGFVAPIHDRSATAPKRQSSQRACETQRHRFVHSIPLLYFFTPSCLWITFDQNGS